MATARKKTTAYQRLQRAKAASCKSGNTSKVTAAKTAYIKDAVKKGKTKTQATATANRVVNKGCSSVKSTKKRK